MENIDLTSLEGALMVLPKKDRDMIAMYLRDGNKTNVEYWFNSCVALKEHCKFIDEHWRLKPKKPSRWRHVKSKDLQSLGKMLQKEIWKMKSFKDLSWDIDEEGYRKSPYLSYSTLARYEREGFSELDHLFDEVKTPALTFGSMVDCLMTGGLEQFQNRYMPVRTQPMNVIIRQAIHDLFDKYENRYNNLADMPADIIADTVKDLPWNQHWRLGTRVKWVKEHCDNYYQLLYVDNGREIVSDEDYNDAIRAYEMLRTSDATSWYFEDDSLISPAVERFYQLKFKGEILGEWYRCMADEIIVDHDRKTVQPIDLKTTGHPEWEFRASFDKWQYQMQARLYWRLIRAAMDKDAEYRDYALKDYIFICVNRRTLCPLAWRYANTTMVGDVPCLEDKNQMQRDPAVVGKELYGYLRSKPKAPNGIKVGYKEVNELMDLE